MFSIATISFQCILVSLVMVGKGTIISPFIVVVDGFKDVVDPFKP